jgi:transcriptional regulator with XRE-family HTH domain
MITYKQIRRARLMRDFSVKEMANKLQIDESTYSRLERGEVNISAQRLNQLLVVFDMNYDFLLNIESILFEMGNGTSISIKQDAKL